MTTYPQPKAAAGVSKDAKEMVTDEMVTAAMRAFELMSSVLRYREKDKWHSCDIMGMRDAIAAALRTLPSSDQCVAREALQEIAIECHRAKWAFEDHKDKRLFYNLRLIGDRALKLRDALIDPPAAGAAQAETIPNTDDARQFPLYEQQADERLKLYRDIFAEITAKAVPVCDPTSDDPERVRYYRLPVGPLHRAAGKLGFQLFNGEQHLTDAINEIARLKAALRTLPSSDQCVAREALQGLYNEVAGIWSAFEHALRSDISNTNYNCVQLRLDAAKSALAVPQAAVAETILEESERLDGTIMQTVRLADGTEIVRPLNPDRAALRRLVDIVWNEATESTDVPSTDWADRLIDRALTNPAPTESP